ncbi:MAG TPA: hypothetical protein DCW60_01270, partial [Sutterella sp.]|nr:hypothetical protein [Sutterella sp.]
MMNCALRDLQETLTRSKLDAYLTVVADSHLSEYIAPHFEIVRHLSGFTGTNANLLVTPTQAWLWTDSRYWEQARIELDGSGVILMRWGEDGVSDPLTFLENVNQKSPITLALNPALFSIGNYQKFENKVSRVKPIDEAFEALFWENRPPLVFHDIWEVTIGEAVEVKLNRLKAKLRAWAKDENIAPDCAILASLRLDDVAWLTNLRGSDIAYNPVFYSGILIGTNQQHLFINEEKLPLALKEKAIGAGFEIHPYEAFDCVAQKLTDSGHTILADFDEINAKLLSLPRENLRSVKWPIALLKAIKCEAEIKGMKKALALDALAQKEAIAEIRKRSASGEILTESQCAQILHDAHAKQPEFITESFATSAATGPNAALPHYEPIPGKDAKLIAPCLLLIDSGAHYSCGTTDTTRVYTIGEIEDFDSDELQAIRDDYTAVFKGLTALSEASFEKGTCGADIDYLAHEPIRALGIDYGHGTGHGVGFILNVHESPPTISSNRRKSAEVALEPGMIHSIEPGIYREGIRGIR